MADAVNAATRVTRTSPLDSPVSVPAMSQERGTVAAQPIVRPADAGIFGLLLVISILRLVILLGWRDGGSAED
jgi:hypothetical protein